MKVKKHIVRLSGVQQIYKVGRNEVNVLKDVNLHIYPEEFTIIYGPSGSGKSTLLNIIIGLQPIKEGNVYIKGRDISKFNDDGRAEFRNETFGVVYQQPYWVKTLNVVENVSLPLLMAGRDVSYAQARAMYSLSEIGMDEFAKRSPVQLSGGQQQKVSVARALVTDPFLVVADEPTGNLDTKSGDDLIELFVNLIKNFRRTVVMVTHDLRFLKFADRAFYINDGSIQGKYGKGKVKDLLKNVESGMIA